MPGFGEKLKSEREARNVTIERIADETGIQRGYLEALEENAFGTLPGRSFGKLYIRSYARMLGIDPQPLIEEYDRELQRARPVPTQSLGAGPASSRPVGSMISSWRQERIAERRRPTTDGDVGEFAAGAGEAEEVAPPDESVPSDTSVISDDIVTEHESFEEAVPADVEDVGQADGEGACQAALEDVGEAALEARQVVPQEAPEPAAEDHGRANAAPVLVSHSTPARRIRSKTRTVSLLTVGLLVVLTVFAVLTLRQRRAEDPRLSPADPMGHSSPSVAAAAAPSAPASAAPSAPSAAKPPPRTPVPEAPSSGSLPEPRTSGKDLSVTESALGRRIADRRVVDQDDRFAEGTEVWFQTRVLGGGPGDAVRHVWIHDGRAVQSIRLPLGRSDWRTQSRKTILHAGPWAVEARDGAGRVLARTDFTCERSAP